MQRCSNGPFHDPVHGLFHNFYQRHVAEPRNGEGHGPDWGHWVSNDFLHWAVLPTASERTAHSCFLRVAFAMRSD